MPRLKNDLVELLQAAANGKLDEIKIEIDERTTATIVAVSGGYPGDYEKGYEITGIGDVNPADSIVFHMGTKEENGKVLTSGGRVLCVTSYGLSVFDAVSISKEEMEKIGFANMYYRKDIGFEFD
jgi:phosphoribosylamine--glycine ligase